LASGHGRYITVAPERALGSVGEWPLNNRYKFVTVSLPKRFRNASCSETATWIQNQKQKNLKKSVEISRKL
jgi:hypothetical protein